MFAGRLGQGRIEQAQIQEELKNSRSCCCLGWERVTSLCQAQSTRVSNLSEAEFWRRIDAAAGRACQATLTATPPDCRLTGHEQVLFPISGLRAEM